MIHYAIVTTAVVTFGIQFLFNKLYGRESGNSMSATFIFSFIGGIIAYAVRMQTFELLDKHGYDQVPAGSSVWASEKNFELLTEYAAKNISPERLMGMMQTTWERIDPDWMHVHHKSVERIKAAKAWYEKR